MLRKIRLVLAILFLTLITLLFLDFTGTAHAWFGWMARIQFLPAVMALNAGVVLFLVVLTLLLGRVYCSVVCPLGVFQDVISWLSGRRKGKKNRFAYSPARTWLRWGVLAAFVVALLAGIGSLAVLVAPYSSYGRIVSSLLSPLWMWGNNALAGIAERMDSYAFYAVDVWVKGLPTLLVAVATVVVLSVLAWRHGRTYCNAICPVGTVLGVLSRHALFRPVIDTARCTGCKRCARRCKSSCIDIARHRIDYSRCVACMDCLDSCRSGGMRFASRLAWKRPVVGGKESVQPGRIVPVEREQVDEARRRFLTATAFVASTALAKAQSKKVDGGLAVIEDKQAPVRRTPLVPPGAMGLRHFHRHCTACQLCVAACPNGVLRPSSAFDRLMQPEMSYERGYCRPECTKCGEVCPTGAIRPLTVADKSAEQIGHAVWVKKNCIPLTDGVACGNCARHCPTGAIQMVPFAAAVPDSPEIPAVNTERCIGCGACENLCPARPFSAIYVEGHATHRAV